MKRYSRSFLLLLIAVLLASAFAASAQTPDGLDPARLAKAISVQEGQTPALLKVPGVVGTAVSVSQSTPTILVLTERPGVAGLPSDLGGFRVDVLVTGKISALHHKQGHGDPGIDGGKPGKTRIDPTARFPRPVPIGVSTGHPSITAGTIGARVAKSGNVYALSNNHVYAAENQASVGDPVLQPGTVDGGSAPRDTIGTLSDFVPILFDGSANRVDAAIALSSTSNLGNSTPEDGYGTPSSALVSPADGMSVQKYGRSSSQTSGEITAINVNVQVNYSNGVAFFTGQFLVQSRKPFVKPGDSGSLIVTKSGNSPVGLLFAGSGDGKLAVGNEIGDVLNAFGVTIDGS